MFSSYPAAAVALAAFLWSTSGTIVKFMALDGATISAWRSLIAAITIFAIHRRIGRAHLRRKTVCGLLYALTVTLYVVGVKYTSVANAIFLQYTAIVYIVAGSALLFREPLRARDLACVALVAAGLLCIVSDGLTFRLSLGDLLCLLSGLSFGLLSLSMKAYGDRISTESVILGNLAAWLAVAPFGSLVGIAARDVALLFYLGVVQLGISYWLYARYVPRLSGVRVATASMLEPALSPLWAFLILAEVPKAATLVGGVLILTAQFVRGKEMSLAE